MTRYKTNTLSLFAAALLLVFGTTQLSSAASSPSQCYLGFHCYHPSQPCDAVGYEAAVHGNRNLLERQHGKHDLNCNLEIIGPENNYDFLRRTGHRARGWFCYHHGFIRDGVEKHAADGLARGAGGSVGYPGERIHPARNNSAICGNRNLYQWFHPERYQPCNLEFQRSVCVHNQCSSSGDKHGNRSDKHHCIDGINHLAACVVNGAACRAQVDRHYSGEWLDCPRHNSATHSDGNIQRWQHSKHNFYCYLEFVGQHGCFDFRCGDCKQCRPGHYNDLCNVRLR